MSGAVIGLSGPRIGCPHTRNPLDRHRKHTTTRPAMPLTSGLL
jgi:hypothetical protein